MVAHSIVALKVKIKWMENGEKEALPEPDIVHTHLMYVYYEHYL